MRMFLHIFAGFLHQQAGRFVHFHHVVKAQVMEFRKDLFFGDVLGKLSDEDGGKKNDAVGEFKDLAEVVLFDNDSLSGTGFQTHAAVGACRFIQGGFPLSDPDGSRGTYVHAMGASGAAFCDYF